MKFTNKLVGKRLQSRSEGFVSSYEYCVPIEQVYLSNWWCAHRSKDGAWYMWVVPMDKENWSFYGSDSSQKGDKFYKSMWISRLVLKCGSCFRGVISPYFEKKSECKVCGARIVHEKKI